jgi:hypothetical protein
VRLRRGQRGWQWRSGGAQRARCTKASSSMERDVKVWCGGNPRFSSSMFAWVNLNPPRGAPASPLPHPAEDRPRRYLAPAVHLPESPRATCDPDRLPDLFLRVPYRPRAGSRPGRIGDSCVRARSRHRRSRSVLHRLHRQLLICKGVDLDLTGFNTDEIDA